MLINQNAKVTDFWHPGAPDFIFDVQWTPGMPKFDIPRDFQASGTPGLPLTDNYIHRAHAS